jgi:hypothetical protein
MSYRFACVLATLEKKGMELEQYLIRYSSKVTECKKWISFVVKDKMFFLSKESSKS